MEQDTTTQLREELDQARNDFRRTAEELRRNLEADHVRMEAEVRRNPVSSMVLAGALGFALGRASRHAAVVLALLTGAAVGYSIATAGHRAVAPANAAPADNESSSRSDAG
jgi:hypothetical protein